MMALSDLFFTLKYNILHYRWRGTRDNAHEKLYELLKDPVPEVRAAAVYALGTFLDACEERTEHANNVDHMVSLHLLKTVLDDGSPIVRRELVVALHYVVLTFESSFVNESRKAMEEEQSNQLQHQSQAQWSRTSTSNLQGLLQQPR
jgi:regulator-associated protein of mTOR